MLKLFQINVVANWGSTGRIAEEIGQLVIANGWDSYIAYGRGNPKSQSKLIRIGNNWDMYNHALQSRLFDKHGLASKKATVRLIEQIKEIKPDIIHLHNIHGYFVNYELLFQYLSECDIPVVWTLHDCWSFTGHCTHFIYAKCDKWMNGCHNCPQINTYPISFFNDRSKQNYEEKKNSFASISNLTLVPVSEWLADLLKKSFLKEYPIHRIYNGVNLNAFVPMESANEVKESYGIKSKFILLGVASRWNARKGLKDFIALREKLSDEYTIILVGLNSQQIKNLPFGVKGVSRTNSVQELAKLYSAADVFVNPTWEDNFPTTNLEALACGTPIVTYHTGGSIEAVDGIVGTVVDAGNITMLAVAISQICEKEGRQLNRELCRKRAVNFFNKDERYMEYIDLYNTLIKDRYK